MPISLCRDTLEAVLNIPCLDPLVLRGASRELLGMTHARLIDECARRDQCRHNLLVVLEELRQYIDPDTTETLYIEGEEIYVG